MKTALELLENVTPKVLQQGENYIRSEDARFGYTKTEDGFEFTGFVDRGIKRGINIAIEGQHVTYLTCTCGKASTNTLCGHAYAILQLAFINFLDVSDDEDDLLLEDDFDFFDDDDDESDSGFNFKFNDEELVQAVSTTNPLILHDLILEYCHADPYFRLMVEQYCGTEVEIQKRAEDSYEPLVHAANEIVKAVSARNIDAISTHFSLYARSYINIMDVVANMDIEDDLSNSIEAIQQAWAGHTRPPKAIFEYKNTLELDHLTAMTENLIQAYQNVLIFSEKNEKEDIIDALTTQYKEYRSQATKALTSEGVIHPTDYLRILAQCELDDELLDYIEAEFNFWIPKLKKDPGQLERIHLDRMRSLFFAHRYAECFAAAKLLSNRESTKEELLSLFQMVDDDAPLKDFLREEGW